MFPVFSVARLFVDTVVGLELTFGLSAPVFTSSPALRALMIQSDLHIVNRASPSTANYFSGRVNSKGFDGSEQE